MNKIRKNFDGKIGSDNFENVASPISYIAFNGKLEPLFILEKNDQDILLTTEIYNEKGKFLAKLYRNNFVLQGDESLDRQREFETKGNPNSFTLTRKDDGVVLFDAKIEKDGSCVINGVFHVVVGQKEEIVKIEITNSETVISRLRFTEEATFGHNYIKDANGIKIFEGGWSLG